MDLAVETFKKDSEQSVNNLREELKGIRTGKANPTLLENLIVETYGGQSKLKLQELATLGLEGTSFIAITPFDPSTSQDIERAILKSPLGFTPAPQGNRILITVPPLSEEQRAKFVKAVNQIVEEKRTILRNLRDTARKHIKLRFEKKELTEDDRFRLEKELDTLSEGYMDEIQILREKKETDIMTV